MKLNIDCVRDTLIVIEEKHSFTIENGSQRLSLDELYKDDRLSEYSQDDIAYSVKQMNDNFLIDFHEHKAVGSSFGGWVNGIKPDGHEFLENIRSDTNWNKIKDLSKTTGSQSLNAISNIAINVVSALITSQFQS